MLALQRRTVKVWEGYKEMREGNRKGVGGVQIGEREEQ